MADVYDKMKELGIVLPEPPAPLGLYQPVRECPGGLLFTSGTGPMVKGKPVFTGRLGRELSTGQGQEAARIAMLNILSAVEARLKDLNRIKSVVKILAFVASADDFYDQPMVINGASQLLLDIFGESAGKSARAAVGVNVLPGNMAVEIEAIFEYE